MISTLLSGPAAEPVSLADMKARLRLLTTDDDRLVTTLIAAARAHLESVLSVALLSQTWRLSLEDWPTSGAIRLPIRPLRRLIALRAYGSDGVAVSVPVAGCVTVTGTAAELRLPQNLPVPGRPLGLEIEYEAGFDTPPPDLIEALTQLVRHWVENRDLVVTAGTGIVVPQAFHALTAPWAPARL